MGDRVPRDHWHWWPELHLFRRRLLPWNSNLRTNKRSYLPSFKEKEQQCWPPGVSYPLDDSWKLPCSHGPVYLRLDLGVPHTLDWTEHWRCCVCVRRDHWIPMHSGLYRRLLYTFRSLGHCCGDGTSKPGRLRLSIVRSLYVRCFTLWLGELTFGICSGVFGRTGTIPVVVFRGKIEGEESFCCGR